MCSLRLACSSLVAISTVLSSVAVSVRGADDYVPPPAAERQAVAALRAKGAILQVDDDYRVSTVVLSSNCTNDDLKLLANFQKLTSLQAQSARITDDGIENLKALPGLTSLTVSSSGLSEAGTTSLRALTSRMRLTISGGMPVGTRSGSAGPAGTFGSRGSASGPPTSAMLVANTAVQDDLKLTENQRRQIRESSDVTAFMRGRDARVLALLTDEQRLRLKQVEMQQAGGIAVLRADIARELNLSADQLTAIRKVIGETANSATAAAKQLRRSPSTAESLAALREKTAELNKQRDEKIEALLNDDQRKAWTTMQGPKGPVIVASPGSLGGLGASPPFTPASLQSQSRSVFDRTDADHDGTITETEFGTIPESVRQRMKDAKLTFEFPVVREDFEKSYTQYLEASRTRRTTTAQNSPSTRTNTQPVDIRGELADEVGIKFTERGVTAKVGGYVPLRAELKGTADAVSKAPEGLENAKYGTIKIGSGSWTFILEEPVGKPAKLFVDTNGDGDLTNDPATTWAGRTVNNLTQYSGSASVSLGDSLTGTINLYRFDPTDSQRAALQSTMMFYPDYGYELTLTLDGKQFTTAISGEGGPMPIWIDRDGNKQRSSKREMIRLGSPFNFTGTTYVLNRDGKQFRLEKPSISLPIAPLPPDLTVGKKAIAFEMVALDGTRIDFPKSYAGKLIMLDFWATWCGPCIAELPNVKKAYADWHDKGFEILGISFDNANLEDKVKTFLQAHDLPWAQVYEGKGWSTTLGEKYDVAAIPFVLLVDGDSGEIVATVRDLRGPGLSDVIGKLLTKKNG